MTATRLLASFALAALVTSGIVLPACRTAPRSDAERTDQLDAAAVALDEFRQADPSIPGLLRSSAGYAVFPRVGKAAVGVGGAYGRGVVYAGGTPIGWADLKQGSIGLSLGAEGYRELIVFKDRGVLDRFRNGRFELGANASAVAANAGAAAQAQFTDGVAVFITGQDGLMADASIAGQKFDFRPM